MDKRTNPNREPIPFGWSRIDLLMVQDPGLPYTVNELSQHFDQPPAIIWVAIRSVGWPIHILPGQENKHEDDQRFVRLVDK